MRNVYASKSRSKREKIFRRRVQNEVAALVNAIASSKEFSEVSTNRTLLRKEIEDEITSYIKNNRKMFFSAAPESEISRDEIVKQIADSADRRRARDQN